MISLEEAKAQFLARRESKNWRGLRPEHVVAAYALVHEAMYKFAPDDIEGESYGRAVKRATSLRLALGADGDVVYAFVNFAVSKAEKKDRNGGERVGWPLLFSSGFLADFKRERLRNGEHLPPAVDEGEDEDDDAAANRRERLARLKSPAELVRATIGEPIERFVTGIHAIDSMTHGGLRADLAIIGGAPGAGKTMLAVQLAETFASAHYPVSIFAADEDGPGVRFRIGQRHGIDLDALEDDDEDAREKLAVVLEGMPSLRIHDPHEEDVEVMLAIEELEERAAGMPAVFVVDSLQKMRPGGEEGQADRVAANVEILKRTSRGHGWLVVSTSEVGRGSYRSNDPRERTNDMAASKWSSDAEYGAAYLFVLRSVSGSPDLVDVAVPKARRCAPRPFRLKLDRLRARLVEVHADDESELDASLGGDASKADKETALYAETRARVVEAVRITAEPFVSANAIFREVKGTKTLVIEAVKELLLKKVFVKRDGAIVLASTDGEERPVVQ